MYARVAVNLPPIRGSFDYHIPPALEGRVRPGHLVVVPFGSRRAQGIVLALLDSSTIAETRPIERLVDPEPVLTLAQLKLAHWLQLRTLAPIIDCMTLMIPPGLSQQTDSRYTLQKPDTPIQDPLESRLVSLLKRRGPLRGRQINRAIPRVNWSRAADRLLRRGIIQRESVLNPPKVHAHQVRTARLALKPEATRAATGHLGRPGSNASRRRMKIVATLIAEGEPLEVTWLYAESGGSLADLRYLEDKGLIILSEAEVWRDPLAALDFVPSSPPHLTRDQDIAWKEINAAIRQAVSEPVTPFLLHGVTGSGKTEIYMRAVAETLKLGRGALILVPEIALTPQTVRRFLARFPGQVGLIHSQLSAGERYDTWRRSRLGQLPVIVGARSALFSPLPNIGLIVLDESHDDSYKEQGRAPYYHARGAALAYSKILNSVCILGSATPDITTTYRATHGQIRRLELPKRILGHQRRLKDQADRLGVHSHYRNVTSEAAMTELPPVSVIDMRQELRAGNRSLFSRALTQALNETLSAGHQAILFLNRRGASTYVFCRDCGYVLHCPRCEMPLTYHTAQKALLCHHCGYHRQLPSTCPNCGSVRIKQFGAGTQRIEQDLLELFPNARTLRWDRDTTRSKGAHQIILAHFATHRADVLIGTQMIAKGLDLPLVTLVGVVSADVGLNLPDFRAAERTFQTLIQVAGRAGRSLLGGRVILQTYQPDHYVILNSAKHDYQAFYQQEIRHRKDLGFPPYRRLTRLIYRHTSLSSARKEAKRLADVLRQRMAQSEMAADLIGPVPCFYQRLRGDYRWQLVLRATDPASLIPDNLTQGWIIDVDPVSLL
jgi:primosomal protein N' (replication factor Y)